MYRTDLWTLREKVRGGCFETTASKHVYYLGWNRSPAQVVCMRQVLRAGALGRPRGIGWRGRWEGRSGWEIHVAPWLIHVNVWQNPLQYCKVISFQLVKINGGGMVIMSEKAMAPHSSTLSQKIPWTEEPGRLQSMGSLGVGHNRMTSLSLFSFTPWRRKWQPTPVFLPGKSQGWEPGGLTSMGSQSRHNWSDLAAAYIV